MAKGPVLTDVQVASFTSEKDPNNSIDFDAQIVEWNDSRKNRIAVHEYLKKDGAECEYMGRMPHRVKFNLVYVGPLWRKQMQKLQDVIDKWPIGLLVHPFFGAMPVACDSGLDGSAVNSQEGIDTVTVPISFVETNKTSATAPESPAVKQSNVSKYSSALTLASAIYASASSAISILNKTATAYAASAVATTLTSGLPDPTLQVQLALTVTSANLARAAIRADPLAVNDAATYGAVSAIELLLDSCNQLDESMAQVKPTMSQYVVPSQTTLMAIAQKWYGKDGAARLNEIVANNPGKILNPASIPSGVVLYLATASLKGP